MNRQDLPLSGLTPATQALSGNDLILLTQNTPNGLRSVSATLAQLLQYLFFGSGETDSAIANLGYLKQVTTGELLEGNGKTNNPLNIKLSPEAGNLLQSRSDGLYYGIGASSDGAIANLGYLKQVSTLNPNSGLIGDGRSSNPMSVNFSYLDTLYVNETDFTNYQNNVNTRFDNVSIQINNINNSVSQGVVPNSRNVNTGAGLVGGGNLSADRTISMGVPSSITSGSSNSASGDTHNHELAPGAVTNAKLANGAVSTSKIGDGSITNAKLANGAVDTINIAQGAITNAHIGNGSVDTSKLADNAVTNSKIADGAVNINKIADGAVISAKLADGAVTNSKIASVDYSKITNAPTQAGPTPVVNNLTSTSTTSALSANQGRVLAEQVNDKLNLSGGTLTGDLILIGNPGGYKANLTVGGNVDIKNDLVATRSYLKEVYQFKAKNTIYLENDLQFNDLVNNFSSHIFNALQAGKKSLSFQTGGEGFFFYDTTTSNALRIFANTERSKQQFQTDCATFEFNAPIYFGENSYLKAQNGYTWLPNGVIMQWGVIDYSETSFLSGTQTDERYILVNFPLVFPNATLNVQTCVVAPFLTRFTDWFPQTTQISSSQFYIILQNWHDATGFADKPKVQWMAIGY